MSLHYTQQGRVVPTHWVVQCKLCHRSIPAWVEVFPRDNIVVACTLCGETRRYRPSEVFRGFPDPLHHVQQGTITRRRRGGW